MTELLTEAIRTNYCARELYNAGWLPHVLHSQADIGKVTLRAPGEKEDVICFAHHAERGLVCFDGKKSMPLSAYMEEYGLKPSTPPIAKKANAKLFFQQKKITTQISTLKSMESFNKKAYYYKKATLYAKNDDFKCYLSSIRGIRKDLLRAYDGVSSSEKEGVFLTFGLDEFGKSRHFGFQTRLRVPYVNGVCHYHTPLLKGVARLMPKERSENLIIAESAIDALSFVQLRKSTDYPNILAVNGKPKQTQINYLKWFVEKHEIEHIIVLADRGKAGNDIAGMIYENFPQQIFDDNIWIFFPQRGDFNEDLLGQEAF